MIAAAFDPCTLDWSRHLLPERSELGEGLFLADAARALGRGIFEGWWGDEPAYLVPGAIPDWIDIPPVEIAFDADDAPIAGVHDAFGPGLRTVLGPAAWRDGTLRWEDEAAWLRSHVPDPNGGPPLSADALNAREGLDADDPITPDNWMAAWQDLMLDRGCREAAATRMTRIADAIAELVLTHRIRLRARPLLGGECDVAVPASIWMAGTEVRLRRLASCGFDPATPLDPHVAPTHLLFADADDLQGAIAAYGRDNLICMFPPNEPWTVGDDDVRPPQRSARFERLEQEMDGFFRSLLAAPERRNWREPDLRRLADVRFGRNSGGIVKSIRKRLAKETAFDFLGNAGQPALGGRPSEMTDTEFMTFVRGLPEMAGRPIHA